MRLRLVLRGLLRAPAFSLASIGTIALAVCLSTTVFAVVDGVLFKPLPYPQAEHLYALGGLPTRGSYGGGFSPADLAHLDAVGEGLTITAFGSRNVFKHAANPSVDIRGIRIDERFFDVIGVRPLAGGFSREDHQAARTAWRGKEPIAAIISYRLWRRHGAAEQRAIGSVLELVERRIRVVGVLPQDFVFPHFMSSEIDLLFAMPDDSRVPGGRWERWANAIVRVDPATIPAVKARLDGALASTVSEYGPAEDPGDQPGSDRVAFTPVTDMLGVNERAFFTLAFGGAAVLILIACVNVTSLVLARTRDRARELRVRAALGASRAHISRLVLGEVLLLSSAGALVGLLISKSMLALAVSQLPARVSTLKEPVVDVRVALFALIAPAIVMGALAIVPLRRAFANAPLSATAGGSTPRHRSWGASGLLALETALGIALLVVGSFVVASFAGLRQQPLGLASDRLATVRLMHLDILDDPKTRAALQDRVLERIAAVPGVSGVSLVGAPVLERMYSALHIDTPDPDALVQEIPVSTGFFEMAGLTLLEGRLPTAREMGRGDRVMVLSQPAARALFGEAPALGGLVKGYEHTFEVVAVVADVRSGLQIEGTFGEAFTPMSELGRLFGTYLFSSDDVDAVAPRVAQALARDIPGVIVERALPLDDAAAGSVSLQRFQASLFGIFAGAALLLISVGVAGIVAGSVQRRWREAGIRTALGASGGRIVRLLIGDHLRPAAAGIAMGLLVSWWSKELFRRFLYELEPGDLRVWALASGIILAVVLLAAWLPARRAAHADPALVLRAD